MSLGSVTMNVTEPWIDEARQATARRAAMKRATKNRVKGKGHPTTGHIDYSPDEWEFISAIQAFKARTGRQFPTWREVYQVFRELGYERRMTIVAEGVA